MSQYGENVYIKKNGRGVLCDGMGFLFKKEEKTLQVIYAALLEVAGYWHCHVDYCINTVTLNP